MAASLDEQEHFNAARRFQEYYDRTLCEIGARAPQPTLGQTVTHYRRETDRQLKRTFLPQNHPLYEVQWRGLRNDSLDALEPQLMRACIQEANNPNTVEPGDFRKVEQRNSYGIVQAIKWIGPECFVKRMGRPGRRVVAFMRSMEPIRR